MPENWYFIWVGFEKPTSINSLVDIIYLRWLFVLYLPACLVGFERGKIHNDMEILFSVLMFSQISNISDS